MSVKKKCCVPDCTDYEVKRHRFPNPKKFPHDLIEIWRRNVNNPRLSAMSYEALNKEVVCQRHFESHMIVHSHRGLTIDAVPTLITPSQIKAYNCRFDQPQLDKEEQVIFEEVISDFMEQQNIIDHDQGCETETTEKCEVLTGMSGSKCKEQSLKTQKKCLMFLHEAKMSRQMQKTAKCKIFYKGIINWIRRSVYFIKCRDSFGVRLKAAEKVATLKSYQEVQNISNPVVLKLVRRLVLKNNLKPQTVCYNVNDKISVLPLFSSSGKGYDFLSEIFSLPSRRILINLLHSYSIKPGLDGDAFTCLSKRMENLKQQDKLCVLIFDEVIVKPSVNYNKQEDCLEGFQQIGNDKTRLIGNNANVFMVKGVTGEWSQPLMFTITNGPIKVVTLASHIKTLIVRLQEIGLTVVATVCGQNVIYQKAIHQLLKADIKMGRSHFNVNGHDIALLFHVPDLYKDIRNNFVTKDIYLTDQYDLKVAKWDHIVQFFNLDSSDYPRLVPELTEQHVIPRKINKTNVGCCTQVFSERVGSLMKRVAKWNVKHEFRLPLDVTDTADVILFLDELYNSLNSDTTATASSFCKPMISAVPSKSANHEFWTFAIRKLESMRYFCKRRGRFVAVSSLDNLKHTIREMQDLYRRLFKDHKLTRISPRTFNKDPIEDFLAGIGHEKTVSHFITSYRTFLLSRSLTRRSHIEENVRETKQVFPESTFMSKRKISGLYVVNRIYRFVAKMCLKITKNCDSCGNKLNQIVGIRKYKERNFLKTSSPLRRAIKRVLPLIYRLISQLCIKTEILSRIIRLLLPTVDLGFSDCSRHDMNYIVLKLISECAIESWCKSINLLLLNGKDVKLVNCSKSTSKDPIEIEVCSMYKRFKFKKPF